VRRDLGVGELARERLDLALVRRQLEVHAQDYSRGTSRFLSALALVAILAAGCGGHAKRSSPENVVRSWSKALNSGDNDAAAALFATDAEVVQGPLDVRLHTHADAVAFNASLPCSGKIVELVTDGDTVTATFVLGDRPASSCDGPGEKAAAVFRVANGKIVLWHQIPVPGSNQPGVTV
jgi:limonene-1,2-epoxide hydrolase